MLFEIIGYKDSKKKFFERKISKKQPFFLVFKPIVAEFVYLCNNENNDFHLHAHVCMLVLEHHTSAWVAA